MATMCRDPVRIPEFLYPACIPIVTSRRAASSVDVSTCRMNGSTLKYRTEEDIPSHTVLTALSDRIVGGGEVFVVLGSSVVDGDGVQTEQMMGCRWSVKTEDQVDSETRLCETKSH
jgi:hypothetical protein